MTRRERLERKVEKRQEWAEKAAQRSDAAFNSTKQIMDMIPFGQPILVGHHSERHARRDAQRIDNGMRKAVELGNLASHHRSKAAGLAQQLDSTIFSDDEDAIPALEAKIQDMEADRDRRKAINALWKKNDGAGLAALGVDLEALKKKLADAGAYWGSKPHLPYEFSNLSGRIRQAKERIKAIQVRNNRQKRAEDAGGLIITGGADYCSVTFAEKPERDIINALKESGFNWGCGSWTGRRDSLPDCVKEMAKEVSR